MEDVECVDVCLEIMTADNKDYYAADIREISERAVADYDSAATEKHVYVTDAEWSPNVSKEGNGDSVGCARTNSLVLTRCVLQWS